MTGQIWAGPELPARRGRGKTMESLALIAAAHDFLRIAQPTTVRGICYRLFTQGIIPSMAKKHTDRVSTQLTDARERGMIPWEWIVDETRELERTATWEDPQEYIASVRRSYRRDFWQQQPTRIEVWSEKGTVRGILAPVLEEYAVGFRVMHGFGSATAVRDIADDDYGPPLVALYCGDMDPSGMCMSERDLPSRLDRYGAAHVTLLRIALTAADTVDLPSFPAKSKDSRYKWYVEHYGPDAWELDAMDPGELRSRVEDAIVAHINADAWSRCEAAQAAEQESLAHLLDQWRASA